MASEQANDGYEAQPLVRVQGLTKDYAQRSRSLRKEYVIRALDQADLTIFPGSTLALVGESGSGKSTLGRCLVRLEEPTSGEVWFEGKNLCTLRRRELFFVRRRMQLIFQDSASALNPGLCAADVIAEPLVIQRWGTEKEQRERALALMEQVGLSASLADRTALQLSGGQRQRLAIARALALEPKLLILDEALPGLDLSIQAQIVNLLVDLQERNSLTYLFISHDLSLVRHFADEVAVLHRGKIVEQASTSEIFKNARDPHTLALLGSLMEAEPVLVGRLG